jgi:hypothetical protein
MVSQTKDVDAVITNLGIDLTKSYLSDKYKRQLAQQIASYADTLAKDITQLGRTTAFSHKVDIGGSSPRPKK